MRNSRGMDVDVANCFTDAIEKETLKRLNWFSENYKSLQQESRKPRRKLTDGILWEALAKNRAEAAHATPRQVIKHHPPKLPERDLSVNLDIMKPIPPEIRALIYQGISQEDEGKKGYLKVRYKEDPEDKFYHADCTNWDYGWGIRAVELKKLVRIPRVQIIQQSFYRRGGVERDPDYYRDAVKTEAPMIFPQI